MADYTSVVQDLANVTWRRFSKDDTPRIEEREISRVFPRDSDADGDNIISFLDVYVDLKNHVANTPLPYVDDPVMENVTYPGRWRLVSNGYNARASGYVQTLRLGWASTVLTGSLPDDEWMVQTGSDSRTDARSFTFLRRNVASTAVNAAVTALRTLGAWTNPTIQSEAKTGVYSFSNIVPMQQADGSYWITIEALKVQAITAIADLAALYSTSIRQDTHDVENAFGLEGGYTAHVGRKPTDGIILTFRALSVASRAILLALTDGELQGILSADEQLKYEFIKRDLQEDAGNTLKLVLAYQYVPLATSITAETARLVGITRKNQSNKIIIEISWPRINPANIDTVMATALFTRDTVTDPVVEGKTYTGEYLVNTTQAPMTENDGIRIVQTMTKAGDQSLDIVTGKDPDHKVYEFFRWDISATDIAEFMTETGAELHAPKLYNWGTPEIGKTKNVSIQKNADESFNLVAIFSNTDDLTKLELFTAGTGAPGKLTIQDTYANTSEKAYGWNIPVASLKTYSDYYAPSPKVVNQRNKFNISRQTEHVFDFQGERETFVPVDSGWIVAEDDEFKTVSIRAGSFILVATLADGEIFGRPASVPVNVKYDQQFKENDLGSFDGQLVKTEFYKQDDGGIIIKDDQFQTITKRVGKYLQSSDITTGDAFQRPSVIPANTTYELISVDNDVGTHDITKTTILFKKVEKETVIEDDEEKTVTRKEGKYLTAVEVAADYARGVAVAGTTVELLPVVPNDVGTFSAGKVTTEIKNQENVAYEQDYNKLVTITENTAAASPLEEPIPEVGHIKSVVNKERPDGKIVTKAVDEEELDQTAAGGASTLLETVAVEEHTSDVTVAVPPGAQNVKVDVIEAPTRGGKKQTKKVTSTLAHWEGSEVVVADDGVTKITQQILKNQTSAPTASTHQEVKLSDNDRGGYNGVKLTKALSSGASGTKYKHSSNVRDFDYSVREVKTPTWSVTTNSDVDAYTTGYNIWRASMTRSRNIETTITKTYTMTEPASLVAMPSIEGTTEGEGTSFFKDAVERDGVWEIIDKKVVTGPWTAWGKNTLTWISWIQTTVGSGS